MDDKFNSHNSQSILVVDDSPTISQYLKQQLYADDIHVHFADTADAAQAQLKATVAAQEHLELLILGADVPVTEGAATLAALRQLRPQCQWISMLDCSSDAEELQSLLIARLDDRPLCTIAVDNQQMLLSHVTQNLGNARNAAMIATLKEQLHDIQQRFEHRLETSTEAIAFVVSGCHLYANPSFLKLVDMADLQQLERHSLLELLVCNDATTGLKDRLRELESHKIERCEIDGQLHIAGGDETLAVTARLQLASYAGEECVQVSLTEKPVLTSVISTEQFPGFVPKQAFVELSAQRLASQSDCEQAHAVLCVRLDHFNETQEQIGLLDSVSLTEERAALLRACTDEENDLLTHYSECLFLIMVSRAKRSAIEQLCQHIVSTFSSTLAEIGDQTLTMTCSAGYTMAGLQNGDIGSLIMQAARAARKAEQGGGNTALRYRPDLRSVDDDDARGQWQERLRLALDNNELKLATMRISDIGDDRRALVSLDLCLHDNDSDTIIYSHAWCDKIQGTGLRAELDQRLIRLAMQKPELLKQTLYVPIAPSEHDGKVLAEWLRAGLKHVGVAGDAFVFMLDTTDLSTNMQPAVMLKRALSNTPIQWGLDQFGATDNTEQLLQHLQPSYVRLCSSVMPTERNRTGNDQFSRLTSICGAAKAEVIACSVDNAAIVPSLWQAGIKLIQGEFIQQRPEIMEA